MPTPTAPSVLVVVWAFPTFSETFVVDHVTGLLDRGWRVSLACVEADEAALAGLGDLRDRLDRLTVLGDPTARPGALRLAGRIVRERQWATGRSAVARHAARLAPALRRELAAVVPDLVHAHFGPNAAAAAVALGEDGRPLVADLHGFDVTAVPRAEGWATYRRLLGRATIVVHSRFAAERVHDGLGREPEVVAIRPGPGFVPAPRASRWPTPLRLLFVGRLVPEKGADLAVTAAARLRQRRPDLDARLTIVGQGPAESGLRELIDRLGLGDHVRLTGALPHDDVAGTMADHDVLLVPSRRGADGWEEAYGLVASEGAATGMGVVAARTGGLPEAAGPMAVIVDPDDAGTLAAGVERLLAHTDPAALASWATGVASGRRSTADHYDHISRALISRPGGGGGRGQPGGGHGGRCRGGWAGGGGGGLAPG